MNIQNGIHFICILYFLLPFKNYKLPQGGSSSLLFWIFSPASGDEVWCILQEIIQPISLQVFRPLTYSTGSYMVPLKFCHLNLTGTDSALLTSLVKYLWVCIYISELLSKSRTVCCTVCRIDNLSNSGSALKGSHKLETHC